MTSYYLRRYRLLTRFRGESGGNVAMLFAATAVVLVLSAGAAVDIGRWLNARDQTTNAIDAAVLASARYLQTNSTDTTGAIAAATKYYLQNVTNRLPVTNDTVSFSVGSDGQSVTATGSAYIQTPFLQLAGIDKLPLITLSQSVDAQAQFGNNLEVALMLDTTGSMAGQKIADLKTSATDLVNTVVLANQSKYTSKVAIVPFSQDLSLPSSALNLARGTGLPTSKTIGSGASKQTVYLSDCVVERTGSQKYTDAAPKTNQYVMGEYTTTYTTTGGKKKGVCTVRATVLPLTNDKTALLNEINSLQAGGETAGHLGTAWAWYTLSPNWSSLWPSANQPAPYGTQNLTKIAILMTDGEYNIQYSSAGVGVDFNQTSCPDAANGCSTPQALAQCAAMKSAGIVVYTVGFDLGGNQTAIDTLAQCASDQTKFYNAANDGVQLQQAFRDIALKISSLYLSK